MNKKLVKKCKKNKNYNKGISLIVLVITIIVIIILATAIILTLNKNNPINEANKARYESDRDSMQSIFTNTVAKIMAKNQGSIDIKAGQINSVKSGVNSTTGEVIYKLENPEKSENKEGKIIFDIGANTEVEYYTGRKLPIYKIGETIWSVDSNGILKLNVKKQDYGNSGSSGGITNPSEDKNNVIEKEDYEALLTRVENLERENKENYENLENIVLQIATKVDNLKQEYTKVNFSMFNIKSINGKKNYLCQVGKVVSIEINGDNGSKNIEPNKIQCIASDLPKSVCEIQDLVIKLDDPTHYARAWVDSIGNLCIYTSAQNYTGNIFIGGTYITN